MYEIANSDNPSNEAKFIKDVISFTNTIRAESAYIIIGVSENEDGTKNLLGLDETIDCQLPHKLDSLKINRFKL